jgi:hypothetical protein
MTCREFKHNAASFSLRELVQQQDAAMMGHAQNCAACEAWMEKQRSLHASLHTLRVRTAGLEAGPDVEGALLRVFRQGIPAAPAKLAVVAGTRAPAGMKEPTAQTAPPSTPFAMRLSRWFELGAYAAVAAAIIVAIFLGLHLLRQGSPARVEGKSMPASHAPAENATATVPHSGTVTTAQANIKTRSARAVSRTRHVAPHATASPDAAATEEDPTDANAGYMALMLCDPLSCASDTQVVRMELPDATGAQPQMADVVVGYDGIVRAVRFVN